MSKLTLTERPSKALKATAVGMMEYYTEQCVSEFVRDNATLIDTPPVVKHFTRSDGKQVTRVYPATGVGCRVDALMCLEFSTLGVDGETLRISLLDVSGGPSQEYVTVTVPNCVDDEDVWGGWEPLEHFLHKVVTATYQRKSIRDRGVVFSTARIAYTWCVAMDVYFADDMPDDMMIWPCSTELVMQLLMYWRLDGAPESVLVEYTREGEVSGISVSADERAELKLSAPGPHRPNMSRLLSWYQRGSDLDGGVIPYTLASLKAVFKLWQTTDSAGMLQTVRESDTYAVAD